MCGENDIGSFFVSLSRVTGLEFIVLICYRVRGRWLSYIRWFGIFKLSCQDLTLSLLACIALQHTRRWGPWSTQGVVTGANQGLMSLLTTPYNELCLVVGGGVSTDPGVSLWHWPLLCMIRGHPVIRHAGRDEQRETRAIITNVLITVLCPFSKFKIEQLKYFYVITNLSKYSFIIAAY